MTLVLHVMEVLGGIALAGGITYFGLSEEP